MKQGDGVARARALTDPDLLPGLQYELGLPLTAATLAEFRARAPRPDPLPPPAIQPVVHRVPGLRGAPDVKVTLLDPRPGASGKAGLLFLPGGGYVRGSAADRMPLHQRWASALDCVLALVDYRWAPETRFPGPVEDCYAGLLWLHEQAARLGIDRARIAVGGASAGGGHAASLAQMAQRLGGPPIALQLLHYAMLDDRTGSSRAVPPHIGALMWRPEMNRFGWSGLLGVPAGSPAVPPGSVPARAADLAGLPPAVIGTAALDLFVRENVDYARRLAEAGVPVSLHSAPGAYHGFDVLVPDAPVSRRYTHWWQGIFRRAMDIA